MFHLSPPYTLTHTSALYVRICYSSRRAHEHGASVSIPARYTLAPSHFLPPTPFLCLLAPVTLSAVVLVPSSAICPAIDDLRSVVHACVGAAS